MLTPARFLSDLSVFPRRSRQTPEVSILLPLHSDDCNDGMATVDAVLGQSHRDIELIIIDDATGPARFERLRAVQLREQNVVLLRLERSCGLTAMLLNAGISHASGRYVGYQFPHARYVSGGLEALVRIVGKGEGILAHGGTDRRHAPNAGPAHLEAANVLTHAAVLHPRTLFDQVGLFDPHIAMQDHFAWDFWQRAATAVEIERVRETVVEEGEPATAHDAYRHGIAFSRMRSDRSLILTPERAGSANLVEDDFLPALADRAAFHSICVLPWLARCFTGSVADSGMIQSLIPREPLTIAVEGSVRSATIEMAFRNYADVFAGEIRAIERSEEEAGEVLPVGADVLVRLRSLGPVESPARDRVIAEGRPLIYALDDDLLRLYAKQKQADPKLGIVQRHLADADYVVAYSRSLVEAVAAFNPRVSVLSMNTPARFLGRRRETDGTVRPTHYVIIGRLIRDREFRWLADEMRAFFARHRAEARLTVFANKKLEPEYRDILEGIDFEVVPLLKYRRFREFLRNSDFDFVINPLRDTPFNRGKSPVKYLEATMAGAILITSAMSVYKVVRHDETGIAVPWKEGAWEAAFEAAQSMTATRRAEMQASAAAHIAAELSTEATYLDFRTTLEAARLHALFRSRLRGGSSRILVDAAGQPELPVTLGRLLGRYHFEIVTPDGIELTGSEPDAATLRDRGIAMVHAAPDSPWIAPEIAGHIPVVVAAPEGTAGVPTPAQPDLILAATAELARAFHSAGFARVMRWTLPPTPSRRISRRSLKRSSGGIRVVAEGIANTGEVSAVLASAIRTMLRRTPNLRVEIVASDQEHGRWLEALGTSTAAIDFVEGAPGTLPRRGILLVAGAGPTIVRSTTEALASGIPVIAVAANALGEFLGGCTEIPADPDEIAEAVEALFAMSPENLTALRERAASLCMMLAGPNIATANLMRFYRLAVENAVARAGREAIAPVGR